MVVGLVQLQPSFLVSNNNNNNNNGKAKHVMEHKAEIKSTKKIGLIAGYVPNRISLYILMLTTGRLDELMELLYKDMEKYKED